MKTRRSHRPLRSISEINMTPLIDLTFLLLITFIITFPLVEQGIPVQLPAARAEPLEAPLSVTVTLNEAGMLYLDRVETTLEALETMLRERVGRDGDLTVLVRGDERLPYARIVEVLRVLRRSQVTRMALVTQDES